MQSLQNSSATLRQECLRRAKLEESVSKTFPFQQNRTEGLRSRSTAGQMVQDAERGGYQGDLVVLINKFLSTGGVQSATRFRSLRLSSPCFMAQNGEVLRLCISSGKFLGCPTANTLGHKARCDGNREDVRGPCIRRAVDATSLCTKQ